MTGISGFLRWWWGALGDLVPAGLRRWVARGRPVLIARPGAALTLELCTRWRRRDLGPLDALAPRLARRAAREVRAGRLRVAVAIPEDWTVRRRSQLPVAAERDLARALRYEIDRLTPFAPDEIYFAGDVVGRSAEQGRVDVSLVYTPRTRIAADLSRLAAAGLPAAHLGIATDQGDVSAANMLPPAVRPFWTPGRLVGAVLGAAAAGLAVVLWLAMVDQRESRIATLEGELRDLRRSLAGDLSTTSDPALRAFRLKSDATDILPLIVRLTQALPDETWLTGLEIASGDILLTGISSDPVALIQIFDAAEGFHDPVFAAPVTRAAEDGQSRFLMAVQYREPTP